MYILECSDGLYYTGSTTYLDQRMTQHNAGVVPGFTAARLPVKLKFAMDFPTIYEALAAEKQVKRWSHQKKRALIEERIDALKELAQCRNSTRCSNRN